MLMLLIYDDDGAYAAAPRLDAYFYYACLCR